MAEITQFYIEENGQQTGPFGKVVLTAKIAGGRMTPETRVWKDGMDNWVAAGDVAELAELFDKLGAEKEAKEAAEREEARKKEASDKEKARQKEEKKKKADEEWKVREEERKKDAAKSTKMALIIGGVAAVLFTLLYLTALDFSFSMSLFSGIGMGLATAGGVKIFKYLMG